MKIFQNSKIFVIAVWAMAVTNDGLRSSQMTGAGAVIL
jgi:hypothetical protein